MTDLIERLRAYPTAATPYEAADTIERQAAEIEELRKALEEANQWIPRSEEAPFVALINKYRRTQNELD